MGPGLIQASGQAPSIDGVRLSPLRVISDERGAVLHMLRADDPQFAGFGECYFSEVNAGALKGWKRHRVQNQNLVVPVGRVRFVICDRRAGSRTLGACDVIELGRPDAYVRLHLPAGLWYGFHGIAGVPSLVANCADRPHEAGEADTCPAEAPEFAGALELLRQGSRR